MSILGPRFWLQLFRASAVAGNLHLPNTSAAFVFCNLQISELKSATHYGVSVIMSQTDFQVLLWSSFYTSNSNNDLKVVILQPQHLCSLIKSFHSPLVWCVGFSVFIPHLRTVSKAELWNFTSLEEVSKCLWCTGSFLWLEQLMPIWVCVSSQLYCSFLPVSFSSDSVLNWRLFFLEPSANPCITLALRCLKIQLW